MRTAEELFPNGEPIELSEAFDDDSAFVEHLVEGLLPESGSMVVGAKKKVGKSVLLGNLTRAVVRGESFLGRRCRQGKVLYGSFDEPKAVTLERLEALGLRGQKGVYLWAIRGGVGPSWKTLAHDYIARYRPSLFVIDTLAKLAGIQEINSYGEWNAAYAPLHAIADEYHCAIVVTVHNKKEGGGFDALAGSTAIGGGVDTILVIERDTESVRTIATEQRVGTDMERTILNMDSGNFRLSIGPEAWLANQRSIQQAIMDAIGTDALALDTILEKVSHRTLAVKRALYAAVDAGFIMRSGRGVRGYPRLYSVRESPDQESFKKSYDAASIPGPGPMVDQENQETPKLRVLEGGGPTLALDGPSGTTRDQESASALFRHAADTIGLEADATADEIERLNACDR